MESWRTVWREGVAPVLSAPGLLALRDALAGNDTRLTQGSTTTPAPLSFVLEWPCEGACAFGYAGWQGEGMETVGDVEAYFAKCCFEVDKKLGEPAGVRWFLNWYDDTPRDDMRKELLPEVEREIEARGATEIPLEFFAEPRGVSVPF